MFLFMKFAKHLIKKWYQFSQTSPKIKVEETFPN